MLDYSRTEEMDPLEEDALRAAIADRTCIFEGCVATWRHRHGPFPGGYDNPADLEGPPIVFDGPDPYRGALRDYNGAVLRASAEQSETWTDAGRYLP